MSPTSNPVVDELISALEQLRISRYLCGVALVVAVYDWLILLGDEYHTIWRTRWTLPKGIYYFNRIVTPVGLAVAAFQLSDLQTSTLPGLFCTIYAYANSLTELLSFFLSNWLLTLRLVALYKRKTCICWFLYTFLGASYVAAAILMVWALHVYGTTLHYSPILHACGSTTRSPLMPIIFIVPTAFEFTLFFLTGFRALQDAKTMSVSRSAATPFLHILYRDGIIYFFVMFGVRLWNIWIYATQPLYSAYMGIYFFWAVMTILSTRVYLNLVFLARGPTLDPTTEVSRVQFASPGVSGGIKMRVQRTTIGDNGDHIFTLEKRAGREAHARTFETSAISSVAQPDYASLWGDPAQKDEVSFLALSSSADSSRLQAPAPLFTPTSPFVGGTGV